MPRKRVRFGLRPAERQHWHLQGSGKSLETNRAQQRDARSGKERLSASGPAVPCSARIQATDLEQGTWIVVLRADEIPHVVMLQGGVCFSLEHDGNRRYPARKLWRLVNASRIPTLFCELGPWANGAVSDTYARFERIDDDGDCFLPVRDYCARWSPDLAACSFPYELVPALATGGRLARTAAVHFLEGPTPSAITLLTYSRAEIRARIAAVRAGER